MKRKFLTKLLAVVMSVGMILQPVVAYADEPTSGNTAQATTGEAALRKETEDAVTGAGDKLDKAEEAVEDAASTEATLASFYDDQNTQYYNGTAGELDKAEADFKEANEAAKKEDEALSKMEGALDESTKDSGDSANDSKESIKKSDEAEKTADKVTEDMTQDEASALISDAKKDITDSQTALSKAVSEYEESEKQLEEAKKKFDEAKANSETTEKELESAAKELENAQDLVEKRKKQVEEAKKYADGNVTNYTKDADVQVVLSKEQLDAGTGSDEDYINHLIYSYYKNHGYQNSWEDKFEDLTFGTATIRYRTGLETDGNTYVFSYKEYNKVSLPNDKVVLYYTTSTDADGNILVDIIEVDIDDDKNNVLVSAVEGKEAVPAHWENEDGDKLEISQYDRRFDDPDSDDIYIYDYRYEQEEIFNNVPIPSSEITLETSSFIKYNISAGYDKDISYALSTYTNDANEEKICVQKTETSYRDKITCKFEELSTRVFHSISTEIDSDTVSLYQSDANFIKELGYNYIGPLAFKSYTSDGGADFQYLVGVYTETKEKEVNNYSITRYTNTQKVNYVEAQPAVPGTPAKYGEKLVETKISVNNEIKTAVESASKYLEELRNIESKADEAYKAYEEAQKAVEDASKKLKQLRDTRASSDAIGKAKKELEAAENKLTEAKEAKEKAEKSLESAKKAVEAAEARLNSMPISIVSVGGTVQNFENYVNDESSSSNEIPAGAFEIVSSRSATNAVEGASAGPSVLGATRTATIHVKLKLSAFTDAQYKAAILKIIRETPDGGLLIIETDRMACFDREILEAFDKKGTIDLEVRFPYDKKTFSTTLHAGVDITNLPDSKGYAGFLRLLALLGGGPISK